MHTWYVLSNKEGTILGVYGSALEDMARDRGREIASQTGCFVALHTITGNRPSVHGTISMRGAHEYLGGL